MKWRSILASLPRNHPIYEAETSQKTGRSSKQKYANYEIGTGVNTKESATRVATLLTVIGNDAIDVFNTLTWDAEDDDKKIDKVLEKLEEYCEPRKNVSYER